MPAFSGVARWKLGVAVLVVAGAAVYANSLNGPFTFDDEPAIVGNASIRSLAGALSPPGRGEPVAGRPLVNLSFALNYAAGGLDVRGYHAVNVALHIACALLLFALARRHLAEGAALAVALLWLVHPLNTEAVNYVSQRTELLMALFYLSTLYLGSDPRTSRHRGQTPVRGDSRWRDGLAVAACAAGMACKETMATAPLVVVLYDRTFTYGSFAAAWRARRRFYVALASTWALLAALIWSGPRWETAGFSAGIAPWTYLLNQAVMLVEYLQRSIWPRSLILDYGEPVTYRLVDVAVEGLIVVALLAATVWALIKRPALGFLGACFFIILAPTSSIIPIATEVGAERRMYLPLAALVALVVVIADHKGPRRTAEVLANHKGSRRMAEVPADHKGPRRTEGPRRLSPRVAAVVVVALLLAAGTIERNAEYRSGLTLWQSTLERRPTPRAHRNVATELKRAGRAGEALVHLRQSITPAHPEARYALGYELFEQGQHAAAAEELTRFVRENPNDPNLAPAHTLIGTALLRQQRYADAIPHLDAAAQRRPDVAQGWVTLGATLAQADDMPRAEAALRKGVSLAPRDSAARMMLGLVLAAQGRLAEAVTELRVASSLDPGNAEAREHLRNVEALLRRP